MTDNTGTKTYLVHSTDNEGGITLDSKGMITTPMMERPEWANGLAFAPLTEHVKWYATRLGGEYTPPQLINADDLHFVGIDEEGELTEREAVAEYRHARLALLLGINTADIEQFDKQTENSLAEVAISVDIHRTDAEYSAFEQSQKTGFAPLQTGTGG